jgi:hypothetical protein
MGLKRARKQGGVSEAEADLKPRKDTDSAQPRSQRTCHCRPTRPEEIHRTRHHIGIASLPAAVIVLPPIAILHSP